MHTGLTHDDEEFKSPLSHDLQEKLRRYFHDERTKGNQEKMANFAATHLKPVNVPHVKTKHRRIVTAIPVPESIPVFATLREYEPRSLITQVPIMWARAEGFQVYDSWGNCWIDFSSAIVVTNTGHGHPHVREALRRHIEEKPLHSYLFATEVRAALVRKLIEITPANLTKVFLLSTGTETSECAIKLARLYGRQKDPQKNVLVSFTNSFHGRTMGAQMLFSGKGPKRWITSLDPDIHHLPFPRCCECPWGRKSYDDCGTKCFERGMAQLSEKGVDCGRITAFFLEGYQGLRGPVFAPPDYVQALRKWADAHDALLVVDEIQSGFGRTGKLFAYQHYGVEADLVCCGKGLSSSLPLSALLGRAEIMDIPGPGQMTSTHTGNPLCCAATLASLEVLEKEGLIAAAAEKGKVLESRLLGIRRQHPDRVAMVTGRGLVHGLFLVRPGTMTPDIELADRVVEKAIHKGVMLFMTGNGSIKICPPLIITEEALAEGVEVIGEALDECLTESRDE